jgi:glutamate racemase
MTVARAVKELLPDEKIIYYGDTARVPYGPKSPQTIQKFSLEIGKFLLEKNVKVIVVACNSSSSSSLTLLKNKLNIPVLGVIKPGAFAAHLNSVTRRIAVTGTRATISSGAYEKYLKTFDPDIVTFSQECSLLVPLVEENWIERFETKLIIKRYLSGILREGIDTIILGCTHYPLLKNQFQEIAGPGIKLIDSAKACAMTLKSLLLEKNLINKPGINSSDTGEDLFYVSDSPEKFMDNCEKLFNQSLKAVKLCKVWEKF